MTLIIAFKCDEGIALVSDTKMTDTEGEASYDQKIFFPLVGAPLIVGAAGYRDLFREFNSKLPNRVNERLAEYDLKNIKAIMKSGCSYEKAVEYIQESKPKPKATQSVELGKKEGVSQKQPIQPIPIPYVYTYEYLMDDCKDIIKKISKPYLSRGYPLELLIGVKKEMSPVPSIHQIDCQGFETQIDDYCAIGSGSPHAKLFFSRFYKKEKPMLELITLVFLTIAYAKDIAKESSVGYDENHPPQAFAILNNGNFGFWTLKNEKEVLCSIEQQIAELNFHIKESWKKTTRLI